MKQSFVATTSQDENESIANCSTHVSGFPHYSAICVHKIFAAQNRMLAEINTFISNYCKINDAEVLITTHKFDMTDNPGSFSMSLHVDCTFIRVGDLPFIVYWLDGKLEHMSGKTIQDAFTRAGYGAGATNAIDFYDQSSIPTHEYVEGNWRKL